MDDRTMLELAAKIMGLDSVMEMYGRSEDGSIFCDANDPPTEWNSLQDDGDALRLAVALGISVTPYPIYNEDVRHSVLAKQRRRSDTLRETNPTEVIELYGDDPFAATRRAITRAAAAIQLAKESGK